jgi:hypothetical protein
MLVNTSCERTYAVVGVIETIIDTEFSRRSAWTLLYIQATGFRSFSVVGYEEIFSVVRVFGWSLSFNFSLKRQQIWDNGTTIHVLRSLCLASDES